MNPCILGIDPGASGGLAWQLPGAEAQARPMPHTQGDILNAIREVHSTAQHDYDTTVICYIEEIPKFVAGGDAASFSFSVMFENYGFLKGVLQALCIPLYLVRPKVWQESLGIGKKESLKIPAGVSKEERKRLGLLKAQYKRDWKNKLKGEAQRRYPTLKMTLGKADAILIMDYGVRIQRGAPLMSENLVPNTTLL